MGWWFSKKSMAPETRPFLPPWLQGGEPESGFARGYEAMFEEVFRTNPVGQRAVRLIAGAVGGLELYGDDEGSEAAVALAGAGGLLEGLAAALLLHGNAYARLANGADGGPGELFALRPERVSIATDSDGWPATYCYRAGLRVERIAARDALGRCQVAHLKALNPGDDHYGAGCLDAAIAAASIHNRASKWNKALLDNAARPSGAMVYAPGDGSSLSGDQFDRLKEEISAQFAGSANAGRPLILEGGMSWQAMSLSPADMDFIALKEAAARDIALAFGVPPVLIGLPGDATYANAREAGRALYRQTVLPLANRLLGGIGEMLSDWLGPVKIRIDTDHLTELAEDRARLWEQVNAAGFLSRDEKRAQLGFAPDTNFGSGAGL